MRPGGQAWYRVETPYSSIIVAENTQTATRLIALACAGANAISTGSDAIAS